MYDFKVRKSHRNHVAFVRDRHADVPYGFASDGASIPRFLWRLFGRPLEDGRLCPAIRHDYRYFMIREMLRKGLISRREVPCLRSYADSEYYSSCMENGCPALRTKVEYAFIRLFGWWYTRESYKEEYNG